MSGISVHFQSSPGDLQKHYATPSNLGHYSVSHYGGKWDDVMRRQWSQVDYNDDRAERRNQYVALGLLPWDEVTIGGVEMRAHSDPCERESLCS